MRSTRSRLLGFVASLGLALPVYGHASSGPIQWLHDDYPAALARARSESRPIVIDMWAPWCHACLSMKHFVLADPGLRGLRDRFVWLAIDTDRAPNAAVQERFPVKLWPTFLVVGPDESVQARLQGSTSVAGFRDFLEQGERSWLEHKTLAADSPLADLRRADRAGLAGDLRAAAAAYAAALERGGARWPRRPDVLLAQLLNRHEMKAWGPCVALASAHLDEVARVRGPGTFDFAWVANECADHAPPKTASALRERAGAVIETLLSDRAAFVSVDDRSGGLQVLREIHAKQGRPAEARAAAERQRALLDRAAAEAPTPIVAMTYNWPRAEVYSYLGRPGDLVEALKRSVAELPRQYDPPYRLAWIYWKMGRYELALEQARRALSLVYGPRKGRVQSLIAAIHQARGDRAAERAARAAEVAIYDALPPGHRRPRAARAAREALAKLQGSDP